MKYGAALRKRLGKISVANLKIIIQNDLRNAVNFLKDAQAKEAAYVSFSTKERILKINRIVVTEDGPTSLTFLVEVLTVSGETVLLSNKVIV